MLMDPLDDPQRWRPADNQPDDDRPPAPAPPPSLVAAVAAQHPELDEFAVWQIATELAAGLRAEQRRRLVKRLADDSEAAAAMRLDRVRVLNAAEFVRESTSPPPPCLGGLVAEGHNALLVAPKKAGKSTLVENACRALVTATAFLGIFDVRRPYRVALLNFEMTEDDERARLQSLNLEDEPLERLLPLNLRGAGLSLTAHAGRRWLIDQLRRHQADIAIIDTYGAASAPSVESENDNAGSRRFLMAWDAIKADAGIHTSLISHHTGRAQHVEGEEHGRGATVVEDWADVILMLTRARDDTGHRFLSSEGRSAYTLPESRLYFDPTTRTLTLPETAVGENRRRSRDNRQAETTAQIVADHPGILTTELRKLLPEHGITNGAEASTAIKTARTRGLIHTHPGRANSIRHYRGAIHADTDPCPDPNHTHQDTPA
jgi:RecA-family ATPase